MTSFLTRSMSQKRDASLAAVRDLRNNSSYTPSAFGMSPRYVLKWITVIAPVERIKAGGRITF